MLGTSKLSIFQNKALLRQVWTKHLARKWFLSDLEARMIVDANSKDTKSCPPINLKTIFPLAHPIAFDVYSSEAVGLKCSKNTAAFLGSVGASNQSVQTTTPFPPLSLLAHESWLDMFKVFILTITEKMKEMAPPNCHFDSRNEEIFSTKHYQFSTPFRCTMNGTSGSYILPRFIAYYEVLVTKQEKTEIVPSFYTYDNDWSTIGNTTRAIECIAIGLATKDFELKRLPGWDENSYGYHSDDGAIFHGRGRQVASYGPSFGAGDTVGCGIDYESRSIFFTVNGNYQGIAFATIDLIEGQVLYPTVGIDAEVKVTFNFGNEPFKFDLREFIAKRENEAKIIDQFSDINLQFKIC